MIIPIYDETALPVIIHPVDNERGESIRYFGSKAITDGIKAKINIFPKTDTQMSALYDFWETDCNYGLDPFIIDIPVFGGAIGGETGLLVRFQGKLSSSKVSMRWQQGIDLEVLGNVIYVVDDLGDVILDDAGDFITADGDYVATQHITSYKEITWQ